MSIRHGLLALLAEGPSYGAALKTGFEARTGGTWPVNVGQVYTTLDRLERDGLVVAGEPDAEGRIAYRLTTDGVEAVDRWWRTPVDREVTPREELVIKLAIAITSPGVDSAEVAQTQRAATMHRLQQLTRLKQSVDPSTDLAWLLVVEHQLFAAEAEIRWLDQVEASVARYVRAEFEGQVEGQADALRDGSLASSRASSGSVGLGPLPRSRASADPSYRPPGEGRDLLAQPAGPVDPSYRHPDAGRDLIVQPASPADASYRHPGGGRDLIAQPADSSRDDGEARA